MVCKIKFKRGSEWRKWDLHIHSKYSRESTTKMEIEEIFKNAVDNDIEVISITDHSNVDGLDEIWDVWENKEYIFEDGTKKKYSDIIEFLPGVELKTDKGNKSVHIVAVFPKSVTSKNIETKYDRQTLVENFLSPLGITQSNITQLGGGDYNRGLLIKDVHFETASELIKELGGLLIVHAGGKDNGADKEMSGPYDKSEDALLNSLGHLREKLIMEHVDILEVNSRNKWNNKRRIAYLKTYNKPTILCSDSHECYAGIKYTWIKADPTFEGLKQIIYEPEDRVNISDAKPENKVSYHLIDKVRFMDNTGKNKFSPREILLNSGLNTIIGGKSTGKSLLLYLIAKTVDDKQVNDKFLEIYAQTGSFPYSDFEVINDVNNFNFEVCWNGTSKSYLRQNEGTVEKEIEYIPQRYLNKLCEKKLKKHDSLNKFILDMFSQNPNIKFEHVKLKKEMSIVSSSISSSVKSLFSINSELSDLKKTCKQKGNLEEINSEIFNICEQIDYVSSNSELNEDDLKQYSEGMAKITEIENKIVNLDKDMDHILSFTNYVENSLLNLERTMGKYNNYLEDERSKKFFDDNYSFIKQYSEKIIQIQNSQESSEFELKIYKNELMSEIKRIRDELGHLEEKIGNKNLSDELYQKLDVEQKNKNEVIRLMKEVSEKENERKNEITQIVELYSKFNEKKESFKDLLTSHKSDFEDLKINISIKFNETEFSGHLDSFNKNVLKSEFNEIDSKGYNYNTDNHKKFIESVLEHALNDDIPTKKNCKLDDAINSLLSDPYYLDFSINYLGDNLEEMSPGKQSLVLLKIIIEYSNKTCPILIDQPEDDLDNRSVYKDLVSFIKERKKGRQIIIVTHNPNVVVGSDSENVVVANQKGQEKENFTQQYQFEYISGSLENTCSVNAGASGKEPTLEKMGIREHVCDVLEGGVSAFCKREQKYGLKSNLRME
ncbi:putative ATPase/mannose/fructose/N-acetylgalactosamine-specific phosphotransferase system component IIB [Methanococcus maripaludis]|uniref:Putative ATPase/mannose/fructose/N-acetylgalactosamine-specific phosphotransferase system component IIB n=1 Tax=Methanococcus maripaludis TaxID=39152 RepID=A0A7J9S6J2_METMI|nr:PHP domain-containing protein [Methanococcus maripaludis]MBB6402421.1 putative ATPase/mannose/fructose/N-acetylgalactosamine-specific phosphotransferase system component IIB [Methanococcus maripaludis]